MLMTNYRVNDRETSLIKMVDPCLLLGYRPDHQLLLRSSAQDPADYVDGKMVIGINEGQALHLSIECLDYVMAETRQKTPGLRQHIRQMTAMLRKHFPCNYQALTHRL